MIDQPPIVVSGASDKLPIERFLWRDHDASPVCFFPALVDPRRRRKAGKLSSDIFYRARNLTSHGNLRVCLNVWASSLKVFMRQSLYLFLFIGYAFL